MGITLGSNFDLGASLPLDSRTVVADITARDALSAVYEGMLVYVESEELLYIYNSSDEWEEFTTGSGGAGSLTTYYSNNMEDEDQEVIPFVFASGGAIGSGLPTTSFFDWDITAPLDGSVSMEFTIPASGSGKYALLNDAFSIPVPLYAQSKNQLITFESRNTGNTGDFSLFLWDETAGATIKDKDDNTLFINPTSGISSNRLWFKTNGTEELRWGVMINTDNTGEVLTIDNIQIDGSPDKEISVYASSEVEEFTPPEYNGLGSPISSLSKTKKGPFLHIYGSIETGTTTASEARIYLPESLLVGNDQDSDDFKVGEYTGDQSSVNKGGFIVASDGDRYVKFGGAGTFNDTNLNPMSPALGTDFSSSARYVVDMLVPIKGWSDKEPNVIVSGQSLLKTAKQVNTFTFDVSSTGVVSNDKLGVVDTYSNPSTGVYTLTYASSLFSKSPTVIVQPKGDDRIAYTTVESATGTTFEIVNLADAPLNTESTVTILRKGDDQFLYEDLILMYLEESQAATAGTPRRTGRSLNGKPIWELYIEVGSDITSSGAIATIDTGLDLIGYIKRTSDIYIIERLSSGSDLVQVSYTPSTGSLYADITGTWQITAGQVFKIEYTE